MRRVLVLIAGLALLAGPSWAGGAVGFYGSWWDTDEAEDDVGGGAKVEFALSDRVGIDFRGTIYGSFEALAGNRLLEFETTAVEAGVTYDFVPDAKVDFYVGGGAGYYLMDLDDNDQGDIDDEAGFYAVGGVDFELSRYFDFFVEVMYRQFKATIEGDDLGFNVAKQRVNMAGAVVNAGFAYSW